MTKYFQNGSSIFLADDIDIQYKNTLGRGTYLISVHPEKGYFLVPMQDMRVPTKLYGDVRAKAERIIHTFESRQGNTGILLSGNKGSGKTALMRQLSALMAERNYPTVLINDKHFGDPFNKFIQKIDQPCMVGFDEFEKTYGPADRYSSGDTGQAQDAVLTLLDGVFTGKKLFVFTTNDASRISAHMLNRPGRIFYHLRYAHLDESIIREYVGEHLKNKEHAASVLHVGAMIDNFQFDMLQALVEEMNRFGEDARTASIMLNIRPENSSYVFFDVEVLKDGEAIPEAHQRGGNNPLSAGGAYVQYPTDKKDSNGDKIWENIHITAENLISAAGDAFVFKTGGFDIMFTRRRAREFAF